LFAGRSEVNGYVNHYHEVHAPAGAVLIVEDERVSRRALVALLDQSGYEPTAVGTAEEALRLLSGGRHPDYALIDLDLPGMSGAELIRRLSTMSRETVPIVISAADMDRVMAATDDGHVRYLRKPLNFDHLLGVLADAHVAH
jgi:CheY-like chemotaxis protein